MDQTEILFLSYILIINLIGFLIMGYDKYMAIKNHRRIPEKTLYIIATVGGALGIYLGMNKFRHKTKHLSFKYGVPTLIVLNFIVYYLIITTYIL